MNNIKSVAYFLV